MRDELDRALDVNPDYPPGFRLSDLDDSDELETDEELPDDEDPDHPDLF